MKSVLLILAISLLGCSVVQAQGLSTIAPDDPELKDLQWNRWTTDNFTILSIDDSQGEWLAKNIEQIKTWGLTRWGFPDFTYAAECRVMCVPNKRLMKKLFNIEKSTFEPRYKDGRLQMTILWLLLDDVPRNILPQYISEANFYQFAEAHNTQLGMFASRGMALMNSSDSDVRLKLASLKDSLHQDDPIYLSKVLMTMTRDEYKKESLQNKKLYDAEVMALCLMLRKEFGEAKLQGFLRIASRNGSEQALKTVYGFSGYEHFDSSFQRYMKDLSSDILQSKTPDSYLDIKPVKK